MESLIERELEIFDSDLQREAFLAARVPPRTCIESWQYSANSHACTVIAADDKTQIVHCQTGFGPDFPWSVQRIGETNLGMDSDWHAYLYEAFVTSTMWPDDPPHGFMRMAPGERRA